jgi:hypothetical protein
MGGPWRERGFDPAALRRPRPRRPAQEPAAAERGPAGDRLTRIVIAYIAGLVASFGLMLGLMHRGW